MTKAAKIGIGVGVGVAALGLTYKLLSAVNVGNKIQYALVGTPKFKFANGGMTVTINVRLDNATTSSTTITQPNFYLYKKEGKDFVQISATQPIAAEIDIPASGSTDLEPIVFDVAWTSLGVIGAAAIGKLLEQLQKWKVGNEKIYAKLQGYLKQEIYMNYTTYAVGVLQEAPMQRIL